MRGGKGGVNYTSGSLARAKAKSKPRSPHKPKYIPNNALFPPKVLILPTPPRPSLPLSSQSPATPTSQTRVKATRPPPRTQLQPQFEEPGYSRLAIPRSPRTRLVRDQAARRWWEGLNTSNMAGERYERAMDERVEVLAKRGAKHAPSKPGGMDVEEMLGRADLLDVTRYTRHPICEADEPAGRGGR